jgi:hypothetical protein
MVKMAEGRNGPAICIWKGGREVEGLKDEMGLHAGVEGGQGLVEVSGNI